ncbi:hypothetical protein I4U23_019562 [Adineta vaga]|nr:hypothetical protein I4U23_019562 [Adineta vaga]
MLTCSYQGFCPITIGTRKYCTACRLKKCLAIGMRSDLIRKEDFYEKYRSSKKCQRQLASKEFVTFSQPCSLDLLSTDRSILTSTNWRLLSNIVHAFDTYSCVPITKDIVKLVDNTFPNKEHDIRNSLNIMTIIYISLQSFIECIADFRVMTSEEQSSLFQRNMQGLLAFYCVTSFREAGIFYNRYSENALIPLYGFDNVQRTKYISTLLDYDLTLVKLMLTILTFSSNCYMVTTEQLASQDSLLCGTFRLFGSQNVYVELLWRYMLYKYDFFQAVQRLNALVKVALDALTLSSNIYESNKVHQDFADEITLQTEFSLNLNTTEDTPLWGKKEYVNKH